MRVFQSWRVLIAAKRRDFGHNLAVVPYGDGNSLEALVRARSTPWVRWADPGNGNLPLPTVSIEDRCAVALLRAALGPTVEVVDVIAVESVPTGLASARAVGQYLYDDLARARDSRPNTGEPPSSM